MTKILVITPHSRNCNSWWRSVGPFQHLEKMTDREIQVTVIEECFTWNILSHYDLIFFHRPFRPDHLEGLQVARLQNIPTWVDYDDWLFDLPPWNATAGIYRYAGIQMVMAQFLACADVVTCSTTALATQFLKVNPNVVLLPNADRADLFPYRTTPPAPRNSTFFWRGTNTHDGDLLSVAKAFPDLSQTTHFLGSPAFQIIESMDKTKVKVMGEQDTFQYFKYIHDLRPKVMLFPLKDHFFNHCKSHIAWLEAVHAGALCVAPDWPEWHRPGVINYQADNAESFLKAAELAITLDEETIASQIQVAREFIQSKYDMKVVNQIRLEIVNSMTSPMFKRNTRDPFCQLTQMWAFCQITGKPMVQAGPETLREKNLA